MEQGVISSEETISEVKSGSAVDEVKTRKQEANNVLSTKRPRQQRETINEKKHHGFGMTNRRRVRGKNEGSGVVTR